MTPRERTLAIIVGIAVVGGLGYKAVDTLLVQKYREAKAKLENLQAEEKRLDGIIALRENLSRRWLDLAGRTFSFQRAESQGRFGQDLKEIAKRHGFDDAVFSTSGGTKIGRRTGISTVAHRITVQGRFGEVIAFLREIYETPYLCQITKLSLAPLGPKRLRGGVKLEFTVESPLLPVVDATENPYVSLVRTMPVDPDVPLDPARKGLRDDEFYEILAVRNVLRSYLPPPENVVMIDNRDRKTVALKIKFFWDEQVYDQLFETVAGKRNQSFKGKGDIVELTGTYADGETFGPKRFDFSRSKDWTYVVTSHTPPPPPTVIDLAVDNAHGEAVFLELTVTQNDGKQESEPTIYVEPGVSDVREYQDVKSVRVSAKYASGKRHASETFRPSGRKQTYRVPPEPEETPVITQGPEPLLPDDPPDPALAVTGLWRRVEDGTLVQEMIATGDGERKVILAGEEGAVDGGTLLAVVPGLGGIVKMPRTGNYYVYPWKGKFTERVLLDARADEELPAAIDAWTRR